MFTLENITYNRLNASIFFALVTHKEYSIIPIEQALFEKISQLVIYMLEN